MPEQSPVVPVPVAKPVEPVKPQAAGLTQPPSQNPAKPAVVDDNPVPMSIRGHKAVPAHPSALLKNPQYKGELGTNPKTFDQLAAELKAKQAKEVKK